MRSFRGTPLLLALGKGSARTLYHFTLALLPITLLIPLCAYPDKSCVCISAAEINVGITRKVLFHGGLQINPYQTLTPSDIYFRTAPNTEGLGP